MNEKMKITATPSQPLTPVSQPPSPPTTTATEDHARKQTNKQKTIKKKERKENDRENEQHCNNITPPTTKARLIITSTLTHDGHR